MGHKSRRLRGSPSRAAVVLTLLALLGLATAFVPAQDVVRQDLTRSGQTQPIQLSADEILTWSANGTRILLLRGNVSATQGNTLVRMEQAVAWVDEAGQNNTGVYMVDLYAEANVALQSASEKRGASQAIVHLATRQIDIKSLAREVQQTTPQSADVVFRRALANREAAAAPPPVTPPAVAPAAPIQQVSARVGPLGDPPPVAPMVLPPPAGPPPAQALQFVQAPTPDPLSPGPPGPSQPVPVIPAPPTVQPPPAVQPPPPVTIGPIGGPKSTAPAPLPGPGSTGGGTVRNLTIWPRSMIHGDLEKRKSADGETWIYNGGIILRVSNPGVKKGLLDIEGDRLVVWTKDKSQGGPPRLESPGGETTNQVEFYIAGHVEMRYESNKGETETLRADEVYYDVSRNVAIALQAELEIRDPKLPYPLHMKTPELHQLNSKTVETQFSEMYSTILPSDPGLEIKVRKTRIIEVQEIKKNIFGYPHTDPKTGEPLITNERYFTGRDMVTWFEGVPIFYWPYYTANVEEPLGPLKAVSFNYNSIFGLQLYSTWDIFSLLGMRRPINTQWRLYLDYLSLRGPAIGSEFDWTGTELFGMHGKFDNITKIYGIHDTGTDVVGSGGTQAYITPTLTTPIIHPDDRGRFFERFNAQGLPEGFSVQFQVSALSDRNFMEQYYEWEYLTDLDQETFLYVKQQKDNWAWSVLAEPRIIDWVTKTEWYPKVDGYLTGETLFDRFVYDAHVSGGYARLRVTDQAPYAFEPTDQNVSTARVDAWQQVSLPFQLGAFKVVPYVVGDLTYYSEDINGGQAGRAYGGAGLTASVPFSKLYPDIQSDLFNLNGIYHKIVLSGNFYDAQSSLPHGQLPQLDRLNDDVTDFTLRNMHQQDPNLIPYPNGQLLAYGPFWDPQNYAMRRLLDTAVDTLDSVESFTVDLRERWQTKRGFPGSDHVVDWMTLDVSTTLFPDEHRDNFGHLLGFVDYNWTLNVGDRTALFSSGWFEPFQDGARVWGVGATINAPDTTNFLISYWQLDPVGSKAVIAQATFPFSAKYAMTASTTWDFGAKEQVYTVLLTRKGTDVLVGFGFSYNSILRTFGVNFEIVPNLLLSRLSPSTPGSTGSPLLGSNSAVTGSGR